MSHGLLTVSAQCVENGYTAYVQKMEQSEIYLSPRLNPSCNSERNENSSHSSIFIPFHPDCGVRLMVSTRTVLI